MSAAGQGAGEAPRQQTIAGTVSREGTGLHSGEPVSAELRPAGEDTGILFRRLDLPDEPTVPARQEYVTGVEWETVLQADDATVRAVEHLLAALASHAVDNVEIGVRGPEPPALDGSSRPWCEAVLEAGVVEQDAPAPVLELGRTVHLEEGDSRYTVVPYDGYRVSAEIDFEHPTIGRQFASAVPADESFCRDVAPARTFGLEDWKEPLRERGLALGATHENTIVLTSDGLAREDALRFPDEFARHKVLDLIGDLALLGSRIRGHVLADRPGHRGNVALARRLAREVETGGRSEPVLDIHQILDYMPHRYPFLLVDRVLAFEAGKRIVGLKNVTINEPFFQGHFPEHPIMPGVLVVEAMAQAGGLLLMNEFEDPESKVVYLMSLDDVKFRRPVIPGDSLVFELEMLQFRGRVCRMKGVGRVGDQVVTEAKLLARVMDR